jgi:hypothetical protein
MSSTSFLLEGKTMTYLGFEPGTFGYQVGNATNWTIEVVYARYEKVIILNGSFGISTTVNRHMIGIKEKLSNISKFGARGRDFRTIYGPKFSNEPKFQVVWNHCKKFHRMLSIIL